MTTLTPQDVADDLRLESVETVLRMLRSGSLPGFKVGRRWRVDAAELADWKANKAARPSDPNRIAPMSPRSLAAYRRNGGTR